MNLGRREFLAACGLAATPPALTGCGLLEGATDAGTQPTPRRGAVETPNLQIGIMPIVGAAPLSLAVREGMFGEQGLKVRTTQVRSGAVSVPTLVNGQMQVTFSNYVSFIQAQSKGIEIRIIAEGSRAAPTNFAVVTMPDSPLTQPDHLRGMRIGVNALNNIATLTTSSVLRSHGVAQNEVKYMEFDFPDMAAVLSRGDVDAAFLPEPFLTQAKIDLGVETLLDPCSGATENFPIDGYGVTREFAESNPNTIRAFQAALVPAQRQCADPAVLQPELVKTTKVDRNTAALVSRSVYPISLSPVGLQRVADLMLDFGAIDNRVDVAKMVILHKN